MSKLQKLEQQIQSRKERIAQLTKEGILDPGVTVHEYEPRGTAIGKHRYLQLVRVVEGKKTYRHVRRKEEPEIRAQHQRRREVERLTSELRQLEKEQQQLQERVQQLAAEAKSLGYKLVPIRAKRKQS